MARDHARLLTAVWDDPEWCALDVSAQHAYWLMLSNKNLSWCGVLDYVPGRFRKKAKGLTGPKLNSSVDALVRNGFVVLDEDTSELLLRSFVRHDKVMERRNMGKAVAYAWDSIVSFHIRDVVLQELGRYFQQRPDLAGWAGFEQFQPDAHGRVQAIASAIASGIPSPEPLPEPPAEPSGMW
jgi:hypothetical protein